MDFEDYLRTVPPPTKKKLRETHIKYLGRYLFSILNPTAIEKPQTHISKEESAILSKQQFGASVECLYKNGAIDEAEMLLLLDLVNLPLVPQSVEDTTSKVKEILDKE